MSQSGSSTELPEPTIDLTIYPWESQVNQYPKVGKPGIDLFIGEISVGRVQFDGEDVLDARCNYVECLLYRNNKGHVIGILNYYRWGVEGFEEPGNVNVWVHPRRHRRGIGTALLTEAEKRFGPINFHQQTYSTAGRALVTKYIQSTRQREGAS